MLVSPFLPEVRGGASSDVVVLACHLLAALLVAAQERVPPFVPLPLPSYAETETEGEFSFFGFCLV